MRRRAWARNRLGHAFQSGVGSARATLQAVTKFISKAKSLPVQSVRVEVLAGPDAGTAAGASTETLTVGTAKDNDLVLTDRTVSRYHLELVAHPDGVSVRDQGSTNGTKLGSALIRDAVVPVGSELTVGATTLVVHEGKSVQVPLAPRDGVGQLRGQSDGMRRLLAQVDKAAQSDIAVLVVGESGTGKELIAQALHDSGRRSSKPFVTVDCAALTATLVASELFGHERGAFTGAHRQHIGAFERANGGTILLDEVGELPAPLQASLLGVLERRRFRRLGGSDDINVDVRVVAATNRDLRAEVNAGSFRLDLYYRIAVVRLSVPPLRDRRDDIPLLVGHFLREGGHKGPADSLIGDRVMQSLCEHHWPGNVRELRNLVEATLAMGTPPSLDAGLQPAGLQSDVSASSTSDPIGSVLDKPYKEARAAVLREFEARYLEQLLERSEGNVSRAAREAQVDRSHLRELLKRHGQR